MSPYWLFLIIPLSFGIGLTLGGLHDHNDQLDRCSECMYREFKEKSK